MLRIQIALLDLTPKAIQKRKDIASFGQTIQVVGTVAQVASGVITLLGILTLGIVPNAGIRVSVAGVCGFIGSREVYLIGKNLENMMTSNYFERAFIAAKAENFTTSLTKDTLVLHRFRKIAEKVIEIIGPY